MRHAERWRGEGRGWANILPSFSKQPWALFSLLLFPVYRDSFSLLFIFVLSPFCYSLQPAFQSCLHCAEKGREREQSVPFTHSGSLLSPSLWFSVPSPCDFVSLFIHETRPHSRAQLTDLHKGEHPGLCSQNYGQIL